MLEHSDSEPSLTREQKQQLGLDHPDGTPYAQDNHDLPSEGDRSCVKVS